MKPVPKCGRNLPGILSIALFGACTLVGSTACSSDTTQDQHTTQASPSNTTSINEEDSPPTALQTITWNNKARMVNVVPPETADPSLGLKSYVVPIPVGISPMPVPTDNPLTHSGVSLGRHLFYDTITSQNETQSCASCHLQELAFTDGKKRSIGSEGRKLTRNSMTLANLAWTAPYFWDNRVDTLEELVLMPIENKDELNQKVEDLLVRLTTHPKYPAQFETAFPGEGITRNTLAKALAQFLRTLVSFNAPADRFEAPDTEISELAKMGDQLLTAGLPKDDPNGTRDICDSCHKHSAGLIVDSGMGLFTSPEAKRNGLQVDSDYGFEAISGLEDDRARFSVPSIRNLSVTGPYMHDGRFDTLMDVLSHYNEQIGASPTPDGPLSNDGKPIRMLLNNEEKRAIVAFLELFTDEFFLTNKAFSSPFPDAPAHQ